MASKVATALERTPSAAKSSPPQVTVGATKVPPSQMAARASPPAASKKGRAALIIAAIAIALPVLVYISQLGENSQQTKNTSVTAPTTQLITRYVNRGDASVRSGSSGKDQVVGMLQRGEEVHGVWVPSKAGYQWLRLTDGAHEGGYVFGRSLSADPPQACSETLERDTEALHDAQIYSEANPSSLAIGSIKAHQSVFAACRIAADWIEIRLVRGGVGYMLASAFVADNPTSPQPAVPDTTDTTDTTQLWMEGRAVARLNDYWSRWSMPNDVILLAVEDFYGDPVDFYGGQKSRADVVEEKRRFALRWPERRYTPETNSTQVQCDSASATCVVRGLLDWNVYSPDRNVTSTGVANYSFTLKFDSDGTIHIVSEGGTVVSRQSLAGRQ
jgi:uncharacterized protein YgiM (DUF1202 family)